MTTISMRELLSSEPVDIARVVSAALADRAAKTLFAEHAISNGRSLRERAAPSPRPRYSLLTISRDDFLGQPPAPGKVNWQKEGF